MLCSVLTMLLCRNNTVVAAITPALYVPRLCRRQGLGGRFQSRVLGSGPTQAIKSALSGRSGLPDGNFQLMRTAGPACLHSLPCQKHR